MFGAILETSGGAQTLAVTMVNRFGDKKAAWALGITGLVIAMPEIATLSPLYLACITATVAGGATVWKREDLSKPQIFIESTYGDSHTGSALMPATSPDLPLYCMI